MNKLLILLALLGSMVASLASAQKEDTADNATTDQSKFDMVIGQDEKPKTLGGGDSKQVIGDAGQRNEAVYGEPLKKLWVPNISSWSAVDDQRLVLYVSPFRPYLLTLDRKAPGLQHDRQVAFRYNNNHIYARFDRIEVDGFPYTIARIEKLDRDTAKLLTRRDKGIDAPATDESESEDETVELVDEKSTKSKS